ncbi:DUF262 domain-containing protein [Xanthobacter autotrophicus]|uniref:DUF262 domain-containing protein n=1 Tax=Xanthobacter autotrophicus TaxID=280 RepID=UPI0037265DD2
MNGHSALDQPTPKEDEPAEAQLEDLEQEQSDKGEGEVPTKPWDPKLIRITTKNFTIREIYSQIDEGELDLAPDFQRSFVWSKRQQTRLIESILLGIPLPAFYFNQDSSGAHQVIDGVQRLTTVSKFMSGRLSLNEQDLEYLTSLAGQDFNTLDSVVRRRFSGTQIVAHVIEPQTPDEVKYDIFNRVNTGGSPLTAQEIRHCMSKSRSREFLKALVESPSFDQATGGVFWSRDATGASVRDNHRMSDREMALRFCAFKNLPIERYTQSSSLDAFLLEYTRLMDGLASALEPVPDLESLAASFDRAMVNANQILGPAAFRRWALGAPRRGPINRAVFESQSIALSEYSLEALAPHKEAIVDAFRRLFDNPSYDSSVRSGTGDVRKLERRLVEPLRVLREIVG